MPSIHFETLGCRLNQDETEGVAFAFSKNGFSCDLEALTSKSPINDDVVLCIVNTCTVTLKAEQKDRRTIRLCLQKCPNSLVIVTGCYTHLGAENIQNIDKGRIIVLSSSKKFILSDIADYLLKNSIKKLELENFIKNTEPQNKFTLYTPIFKVHSRSSLKIQDGCNNSCSYCAIHFARGNSVSLPVDDVLNRVNELKAHGTKEIVFTGVNLSQYAGNFIDDDGKTSKKSFLFLLDYLLKNTTDVKFRISSFYPQHITEELCKILASDRVQPFFHLSIQSGSNKILKAMNRPYLKDDVLRAVHLLKKYKKNCFISCDIIAGFPGETEEDFEQTILLFKNDDFAWIHAFPFSARPGTLAFSMKNQILEKIKAVRVKKLFDLAVRGKIKFIESVKGQTFSAIVENSRALRVSSNNSNVYHCVTENFLHAEFYSLKKINAGDEVQIKITAALKDNIALSKELDCSAILVNLK